MLDILLLRFEAPLMSFGGDVVDQRGVTREFPTRGMLTGLIANALGYDHADTAALTALQSRLAHASRQDVPGSLLEDYQTVALGMPWMQSGWTSRGAVESRAGANSEQTHIRERFYLADAVYTVALTLDAAGEIPTLDDVERALRTPARPLFLGRKTCLPAAPILHRRTRAERLRDALATEPMHPRARRDPGPRRAWWPAREGTDIGRTLAVTEDMDWANQIHVGRRFIQEASVTPPPAPEPRHA